MKNGYTHRFGKSCGGVQHLLLSPACNIHHLEMIPSNGTAVLKVHDPENIYSCVFAENGASYSEQIDNSGGIPSVYHRLEFHTDKIDRRSDTFIRMLTAASCCGWVAVITTCYPNRLIVGYSELHRAERPLRVETISADTGRGPANSGGEVIRLSSRDTVKASPIDTVRW